MPGGTMRIRQQVVPADDDHDDDHDDGIPPEILEMLHLTEAMSSGFGFNPMRPKPKKKVERHDESTEDIMARMNKLSDQIGEKHEQSKYELADTKG